ncbi:peptide ABC transporter permease [Erysipelothrix larvae]|uniref:Peptide ABC transporter permease n=1 Tax=Erysipelothrix larvae TaxID=1514105 RepID=A0A0X8GY81_9FIRM|nr:oligopeptide ABC transporter permease [Erysipelothrix larvae]AMC92621.1 peptide ABC transporter permease [Erysipelothrix larvae]
MSEKENVAPLDALTQDDFVHVGYIDRPEQEMVQGEDESALRDGWERFKKNKGAVIGLIVISIIIVMAIIGPMISGYRFDEIFKGYNNLPPRIPGLENLGFFDGTSRGVNVYEQLGVTQYFWFGSDTLGRDLFTRIWSGTRVSFIIAIVAVLIDFVIGVTYGTISGYFGGKVDMLMQRILEVINGIPNLVVVTLFVLVFKPGMVSIIVSLMITGWIGMSRVVRSQVLKLKEQEFVLAADVLGARKMMIIVKEILPNIMGQMIVMTMFSIPNAIFYEAFLAFVGLGLAEPQASLGSLINTGYNSMLTHPHLLIFPVIVLSLLMLSFNLIADGLRDAIDPTMKGH